MQTLIDNIGRFYRKLRISVTDRCQFRCTYCMPDGPQEGWLAKKKILSYEQIEYFTRIASTWGISDVRLTGGEPLLRQKLHILVSKLNAIEKIQRVSLTTNGILLPKCLAELLNAGIDSVTISIDSLNQKRFEALSGGGNLKRVLNGIHILAQAPDNVEKKLNAVIIKGQNDQELPALIQFAASNNMEIRFIEYMPFGSHWGWDGVVTKIEMLNIIQQKLGAIQPIQVPYGSTSQRWLLVSDPNITFGIIPSMGETICAECDRIRLTADGRVLRCLFDDTGISIKRALELKDQNQLQHLVWDYFQSKGVGYLATQHKNFVPLSHMHKVGG